jgi:hypothetical protein
MQRRRRNHVVTTAFDCPASAQRGVGNHQPSKRTQSRSNTGLLRVLRESLALLAFKILRCEEEKKMPANKEIVQESGTNQK